MKIFNYILTAILAITMIASCETAPSVKNVTLLPSSNSFNAGIDTISFTVQYGEEDVTADAQVFTTDNAELTDKKFSSSIPGNYNFYAIYNDMASVEVTVTALGNLELIADKTTITPDGSDVVTFTVMQDGIDVTSESTLYLIPEDGEPIAQDGFTFSTTEEGSYKFYATKGSASSNTVTINAFDGPDSWSFRKRAFILEVTSTGCGPCALNKAGVLHLEQSGWDDGYVAEFHVNMRNNDPMRIPELEAAILNSMPGFNGSIPYLNWNYSEDILFIGAWQTPQYAANGISQYTNRANNAYPCTAGANIVSYTEENGTLTVSANIAIAEAGNYKVNCWIVEDNIKANQASASAVPGYDVSTHMNVIRAVANSYDICGNPVTAGANEIQNFTWTFETSEVNFLNDNLEETHVYVVIAKEEDAGYIVNNVVNCEFNGTTDYEYAE